MIRTLLATTAISTLLATGAFAQTPAPTTTDPAAAPVEETAPVERADGHLASNIIGENIYTSVADDAENIGSVSDIVIGSDGSAENVIVGVGGFLGLGQREVALSYDEVEWAARPDGTTWLVVNTTREQLEQAPEFNRDAYDPAVAVAPAATTDGMADTPATTDGAASPAATTDTADPATDATAPAADTGTDGMAATDEPAADGAVVTDEPASDGTATTDAAPAAETDTTTVVDRTTLSEVDAAGLSADELIGTTVYGADDENVGSISDVVLTDDGETDVVTIDVGGFLGMGTKEVAVDMDNLEFLTDEDGNMYLYTSFTQEQLEAQPEYDEATFTEQRDDQILVNPAN